MRSVAGKAIAFLVAGLVALTLVATVVLPLLGGGQAYTVLTASMSPGMPPGTLVVVRPRPVDEIRVGDVITYQLESGRPTVATHRVQAIGTTLRGERILTTQGDANDAADPEKVGPVQVRGVEWYSVPYLGYISTQVNVSTRGVVVFGAALLLLGYSAMCLVGAARDARRRQVTPEPERQGADS